MMKVVHGQTAGTFSVSLRDETAEDLSVSLRYQIQKWRLAAPDFQKCTQTKIEENKTSSH
jgi:hypothetical protein